MTRLLVACAFVIGLAACGIAQPETTEAAYPSAGLYTPGSLLGASDPTDTPTPGMGLGQRCDALGSSSMEVEAATEGNLTLVYNTRTLGGRYAPKNCTAAWIETMDGRYVATIELAALLRKPGLVYFQEHACPEKPGPDVVTSATLADHSKMHMAVWKGRDLDDTLVPDGPYVLFIEVAESDKEPGVVATYDFVKGPDSFSGPLTVAVDGALDSITLAWAPVTAGAGG